LSCIVKSLLYEFEPDEDESAMDWSYNNGKQAVVRLRGDDVGGWLSDACVVMLVNAMPTPPRELLQAAEP